VFNVQITIPTDKVTKPVGGFFKTVVHLPSRGVNHIKHHIAEQVADVMKESMVIMLTKEDK
jgi:hypothetical protein